jgi:pilus assembly protein CpaF
MGNVSDHMVDFLTMVARSRLNVIISGGTGSGKTTLLNALSELINEEERIVTIEDAAELKLQQPHVVRLESRPDNIEGKGLITIRDLVKNALRMRPDRIIVGECRGAETFDMLQAMNTGHDGSMSTLHSNSANEALSRLENMVLMSGNQLPNEVIRNYIADAVDVIVQLARMRDGTRRIVQITEVSGYHNGEIKTNDIFVFQHTESDDNTIRGKFLYKGLSESLMERVLDRGFKHEMDRFVRVKGE